MKCRKLNYLSLCIIYLVFAFGIASAQTETSAPSKDKYLFACPRITEQLVRFNVLDKKGQEVFDLKAEDFLIYESGQRQDIDGYAIYDERLKIKTGFRYVISYTPQRDLPDGKYRKIQVLLKTKIKGRPKIQQSLKGYVATKEHFGN